MVFLWPFELVAIVKNNRCDMWAGLWDGVVFCVLCDMWCAAPLGATCWPLLTFQNCLQQLFWFCLCILLLGSYPYGQSYNLWHPQQQRDICPTCPWLCYKNTLWECCHVHRMCVRIRKFWKAWKLHGSVWAAVNTDKHIAVTFATVCGAFAIAKQSWFASSLSQRGSVFAMS